MDSNSAVASMHTAVRVLQQLSTASILSQFCRLANQNDLDRLLFSSTRTPGRSHRQQQTVYAALTAALARGLKLYASSSALCSSENVLDSEFIDSYHHLWAVSAAIMRWKASQGLPEQKMIGLACRTSGEPRVDVWSYTATAARVQAHGVLWT